MKFSSNNHQQELSVKALEIVDDPLDQQDYNEIQVVPVPAVVLEEEGGGMLNFLPRCTNTGSIYLKAGAAEQNKVVGCVVEINKQ